MYLFDKIFNISFAPGQNSRFVQGRGNLALMSLHPENFALMERSDISHALIKGEPMKYDINNIKLAKKGKLRIEWADENMPVLRLIRERFKKTRPLKGVRIDKKLLLPN